MDYAANELEKVAKDLDEQSDLEHMVAGYPDKFGPNVSGNPKLRAQYMKAERHRVNTAQHYHPDKLVPGSSGKK
jgi:hypothetical protein